MNERHKCWNCGATCDCFEDGEDDCQYCEECNRELYEDDEGFFA